MLYIQAKNKNSPAHVTTFHFGVGIHQHTLFSAMRAELPQDWYSWDQSFHNFKKNLYRYYSYMPARRPRKELLDVTRQMMIPIMKYRERSTSRSVAFSFQQPLHRLMSKVVILDSNKCMYIYLCSCLGVWYSEHLYVSSCELGFSE